MATHASTDGHPLHGRAAAMAAAHVSASWLALGTVTMAATLVFWAFDALPFQDLPAHAGLIALRHRLAVSPFEQRFFVLTPHLGPYSLFRSLGEALLPLFGAVGSVRAMATLPVVATPLALLWARRRLHGDRGPTGAYFGLALSFGLMTLLGFASYQLGIAMLIVALTIWLELLALVDARDRRARRREAAVVCLAPLLLVAHGFAFAIFVLLAAVCAVAAGQRAPRLVRLRALTPALALATWMVWAQHDEAIAPGSVRPYTPLLQTHFQGAIDKLSLLITPTLLTRTGLDALVGLMLWAVLLVGVGATVRSVRERETTVSLVHTRALLGCLVVLSAAFLALPHAIGWFGFVDGRLVPLLLMLAVMAVQREAFGRSVAIFYDLSAPVAACAMTIIAFVASHLFQKEARGWREMLASIPAEARLLNLPLDPNSEIFTAHPFIHYDKLALADRPLLVSDVWFHQGSALFPTADNPALRLPASYSESNLRVIDWPAYRLRDWDYVLIRTRPNSAQPVVPNALALTAHIGGWWLFRTH